MAAKPLNFVISKTEYEGWEGEIKEQNKPSDHGYRNQLYINNLFSANNWSDAFSHKQAAKLISNWYRIPTCCFELLIPRGSAVMSSINGLLALSPSAAGSAVISSMRLEGFFSLGCAHLDGVIVVAFFSICFVPDCVSKSRSEPSLFPSTTWISGLNVSCVGFVNRIVVD